MKDEIQKVILGTNEALRVTAEGEFIWHPEADAMIEEGDFASSPAMRHILRALRKALAAPVQKGAIGAEYQKSPWDGKGASMSPPAAQQPDVDAMVALARADERNRTWTQEHWTEYERSIAAAEREACAKTRAGKPRELKPVGRGAFLDEQQFCFDKGWREGAASVRAAIRARGNT